MSDFDPASTALPLIFPHLTEAEMLKCRVAFEKFDVDGSGAIDPDELARALESVGQAVTEDDIHRLLNEIDDNEDGLIQFIEFLSIVNKQKIEAAENDDEADLMDSYVAMGGDADGGGCIQAEKLRKTCKMFELAIDIDALIREVDTDGSGEIEFGEWAEMFGSKAKDDEDNNNDIDNNHNGGDNGDDNAEFFLTAAHNDISGKGSHFPDEYGDGPSEADMAFLERFEACKVAPDEWRHRTHLRVIFCCLIKYGNSEEGRDMSMEVVQRYCQQHKEATSGYKVAWTSALAVRLSSRLASWHTRPRTYLRFIEQFPELLSADLED